MRYRLRSCVWEITLNCPFNCTYCGSKGGEPRDNELTTEECLAVNLQLAELGCKRVSLIGGEVFLRDDWKAIVCDLIRQEIHVSLVTNGYLIDDKCAKELSDIGIESIAISIDGPEFLHDIYRMEGSFGKAIDAIDRLTKYDNRVSVITTLNAENVMYLEKLYHELCQHKIFAWQLQACSPMGNAAKNHIEYQIDFQTVMDFISRHVFEAPFAIGIADNIGYYSDREGFLRGNRYGNGYFLGCRAGLTALAIDSVGNVRGCESMYDDYFIEGNLRNRSLKDIWEDPNAFLYNRDFSTELLEGKCKTCDKGQVCAGGCRSYNYFDHGNIYKSIRCIKNREI